MRKPPPPEPLSTASTPPPQINSPQDHRQSGTGAGRGPALTCTRRATFPDAVSGILGSVLPTFSDTGFGFVRCGQGHRHWGRFGAAGLLVHVADEQPAVLLQLRSRLVQYGGTWALPGGGLHRGETAAAGALRETAEETDLDASAVRVAGSLVDEHGGWSYTTVLGQLDARVPVTARGWEVSDVRWFRMDEVRSERLHPGLAATWARLRTLLG